MAGDEEKSVSGNNSMISALLGTADFNLAPILEIGSHETTIIFIGSGCPGYIYMDLQMSLVVIDHDEEVHRSQGSRSQSQLHSY